jgi:transcriptional regulator with XRE-family HTH domain
MTVTSGELARRLHVARRDSLMTQADASRRLGVSRSTLAQIETGRRSVSGLELDRFAQLYGRDIRELVADSCRHEDALAVLFQSHPRVAWDQATREGLRKCLILARETTNIEKLLGIGRHFTCVATCPMPAPQSRIEAVWQGDVAAGRERQRLGFGESPLPDTTELLEGQGVRTAHTRLPDDICGLALDDPQAGVFVAGNSRHDVLRRRFWHVHEYAHVVLDREQGGTVCCTRARSTLLEVRANAFAASFLMPERGSRQFIHAYAKGRPSRDRIDVYDEAGVVHAEGRSAPGTQAIQIYDVVLLAQHFGVSCSAAIHRLHNLRLINGPGLSTLQEQDRRGVGVRLSALLGMPGLDHEPACDKHRGRLVTLAIEACRRERITRAKLRELAALVDIDDICLERIIEEIEVGEPEPAEVVVPEFRASRN